MSWRRLHQSSSAYRASVIENKGHSTYQANSKYRTKDVSVKICTFGFSEQIRVRCTFLFLFQSAHAVDCKFRRWIFKSSEFHHNVLAQLIEIEMPTNSCVKIQTVHGILLPWGWIDGKWRGTHNFDREILTLAIVKISRKIKIIFYSIL